MTLHRGVPPLSDVRLKVNPRKNLTLPLSLPEEFQRRVFDWKVFFLMVWLELDTEGGN